MKPITASLAAVLLTLSLDAAALVTIGDPAQYLGAPFPVARLSLSDGVGDMLCSGAPIAGGRYIMTAAHCLRDTYQGANWRASTATVEIFGSTPYTARVEASQWHWHEDWTGSILDGHDIALIRLPTAAPTSFEIDRTGFADSGLGTSAPVSVLVAGFGDHGQGMESGTFDGLLRVGTNHYDALGTIPGSTYRYDFDDNTAARNALGLPGYTEGPGWGPSYDRVDWNFDGSSAWGESMIAGGDSGGPSLVEGIFVVGVHSYGEWSPFDADNLINSSPGEIGVDTRVAFFAPWIDSHTSPVPEAPGAALMCAGLLLVAAVRGKPRR